MAKATRAVKATDVVLHVGFQKAASSQIQHALRHAFNTPEDQGVHYVHLRDLRKKLAARQHISEAAVASRFFAGLHRKRPKRLILSDENLLGQFGHCVRTGQLFQQQSPFLSLVAQQVPFEIKEIHLAVQNYADFFTTAYIRYLKALKSRNAHFIPARMMCLRVFDQLQGWPDLIAALSAQFPDARLHVWRHESFCTDPQLSRRVLNAFVGSNTDSELLRLQPHVSRRGPFSGRAVTALETVAMTQGMAALVGARKDIRATYPVGKDQLKFDPFLAWERNHLDALYKADLKQLRSLDAVMFVE